MPTLNWIGKEKVVNHHHDVPYHVLEHKFGYSNDDGETDAVQGSGNMIIQGDNLVALKSLLPQYEGRIDVFYLDPPYNTGNEHWCYNDNVNDPHIQKWLGEVVGQEGEDLCRHDKWLCMMYPRLKLVQRLMSSKASLVISISYHELHSLIYILREIFATKQIIPVTVQTSGGKPSGGFDFLHEYIVFVVDKDFEPNVLDFCGGNPRRPFEGLTLSTFNKSNRPNQTYPIFIDPETECIIGVGKSLQELIDSGEYEGRKEDFEYDWSIAPKGSSAVWPITSKGKECVWRQIPTRIMSDWNKGYIKVSRNSSKLNPNQYSVQYLPEGLIKKIQKGILEVMGHEEGKPTLTLGNNETEGSSIPTIWSEKEFYTVKGTKTLKLMFPTIENAFDYPKAPELIKSILQAVSSIDSIILDPFAGSGTTAQAVYELNCNDGGNRTFILCEMNDYAETVTATRIEKVISGYQYQGSIDEEVFSQKLTAKNISKPDVLFAAANQAIEENGNNYDKIGKPVVKDGCLKVIGTKVYDGWSEALGGSFDFYKLGVPLFNEDGSINPEAPLDSVRQYVWYSETKKPFSDPAGHPYYLGEDDGTAYYLCYEKDRKVALAIDDLEFVSEKADAYIIYADVCLLEKSFMEANHIIFKKSPRDISRF